MGRLFKGDAVNQHSPGCGRSRSSDAAPDPLPSLRRATGTPHSQALLWWDTSCRALPGTAGPSPSPAAQPWPSAPAAVPQAPPARTAWAHPFCSTLGHSFHFKPEVWERFLCLNLFFTF